MVSKQRIHSNRANAQASTGPRSEAGRARSSGNALRHALCISIYSDPVLSEEVEVLAREIAGVEASIEVQGLARRVAEAQVDLRRVREARHQLLSRDWADPYYDRRENVQAKLKLVGRF